jgi:20S proteasome alpha/beta subunit
MKDYHDVQKKLHDAIVLDTNERIRRYTLGLTLLLAGIDDQGHIIVIDDPGIWRSYDNLAHCCPGIGERHANNVFAWYRYTQRIPLNEAIYIAFEAKKKAEMAGGVGRSTDILLIGNDGIKSLQQETIIKLEEVYDERESRSQRRGFDKAITELEIQADEVAPA